MTTVGVTSGASVPELLVRDVLTYLAERGYDDVTPVVAAEESLLFSLPNEIRRDLKAKGLSRQDAPRRRLRGSRLAALTPQALSSVRAGDRSGVLRSSSARASGLSRRRSAPSP